VLWSLAYLVVRRLFQLMNPWGAETRLHVPIWPICSGIEFMHPQGEGCQNSDLRFEPRLAPSLFVVRVCL
jgi:hypothetical protein